MRITNILTVAAIGTWAAITGLGRLLLVGVETQRAPGYPSLGQIDLLIIGPLGVVSLLLMVGWIGSVRKNVSGVQRAIAVIALLAVLPYLFLYGGGV